MPTSPTPPRHVRVAVPVPALESLTYRVPPEQPYPVVGARVLVPLGSRVLTGIVVELPDGPPEGGTGHEGESRDDAPARPAPAVAGNEIKPVIDLLDSEPFLPSEIVQLAAWTAEYYACGIGEAMAAAMPPRAWVESERYVRLTDIGRLRQADQRGARRDLLERLTDGRPRRVGQIASQGAGHATLLALAREGLVEITMPLTGSAAAFRTVRVATLTAQGHEIAALDSSNCAGARLGGRQREALALLAGAPDGLDTPVLAQHGIPSATLARLAGLGLVSFARRRLERDPFQTGASTASDNKPAMTLTLEQQAALERLRSIAGAGAYGAALLHGVTGSGKTELYLRLASEIRARGRSVLLLVPEIALTPAVAGQFRTAFGERVAIQHSGLADGERYDQWHRIRRGDVDVVVGTRSAVFAPLRGVGLIVVDEEHDGSYKQEESPRYNGRDLAVVRARQAGALVVLGSATPSLESYQNAVSGRYTLVALERRILDRPLAEVRVVDMREEYAAGGPDVILSRPLREALLTRLERAEQAIVLLNRRGFATAIFCRQCGATLECPNCSISLTVHRAARRARCHYCNYSLAVPKACAACGGAFLEQTGFGTERVEAEVIEACPGARVTRLDRDTIRRRGAMARALAAFARREIDVLVGTQMIAKGHDFPFVTLVGVVSADIGLGLADFRASERTFQLLTQVAGRAGRGDLPGEALIQTIHPGHYSILHACRQDYRTFFSEELSFRQAMRYPPAISLVNVIVKGRSSQQAMQDAGGLVEALRRGGAPYRVLGPAPAPLARLKGEHRAQFFIKGTNRGAMRRALLAVLDARPELKRRTIVDVDPMSVL
ncbi:MAG TPA: primosomal protein N' [Vicinamibacterales bacterium]|nr:primosomal protein N' [Vicinamibacterales bacterium]